MIKILIYCPAQSVGAQASFVTVNIPGLAPMPALPWLICQG